MPVHTAPIVLTESELPSPSFELLGDRILILRDKAVDVTQEGIHLPTAAKETKRTATVVLASEEAASGKGKFRRGDRIAFPPYVGTEITLDKVDYLLLETVEVLGVIRRAQTP